eukprot:gene16344-19441_t
MLVTLVTVYIEWFKVSSSVTFAGETWTVPASSIKFSIVLSKYDFSSPLNNLALVLNSNLSIGYDGGCSLATSGSTDASLYDWMTLQVNHYSLYGNFIKRGVVDGRKWLTTGRLVGIIIGSISFATVALIIVFKVYLSKKKHRIENLKIANKLKQLN